MDHDILFSKLTEPKEFYTIYLPKNNGYYAFQGYISGVEDVIEFLKGESARMITDLKCDIVSKQPIFRPRRKS